MPEPTRSTSAWQIGTTALITTLAATLMMYIAGDAEVTGTLTTRGNIIYTGALIPIRQAVTLSEVDGYASGSIAITNPVNKNLYCNNFAMDIERNSSPQSLIDINIGTGAVGTMGKIAQTGSTARTIANNYPTVLGMVTFTGASLLDSGGKQRGIELAASGSGTGLKVINITSDLQTGSLLEAYFMANCYVIEDR